jgi:hypothetical protein
VVATNPEEAIVDFDPDDEGDGAASDAATDLSGLFLIPVT